MVLTLHVRVLDQRVEEVCGLDERESAVAGESRMPNYNDVMTVQELIDLVAYLQPQYEVIRVTPLSYDTYYP